MVNKANRIRGLPLGGIAPPGMRFAAEQAIAAEMDAAKAALWANNVAQLNLRQLRHLTVGELADRLSKQHTGWDVAIPSYVMATLAAAAPKPKPPTEKECRTLPDELLATIVEPPREPPHEVRSCGCQVNAPHICGKPGT